MVAPVLGMVPPVDGVPVPAPAASERPAPAQSANRGVTPPGSARGSGPGVPRIAQRIGRAPVLRSDPANAAASAAMIAVGLGPIVPSAPVPVSSGAIVPTVGPASSAASAPLGRSAFPVRPGPVGPSVSADPSASLVPTASVARIELPPPPGREVQAENAGSTVASPVFPAARSGRVPRPTFAVANGQRLRCSPMPADRNRAVKPPAMPPMSAAT